MYFNYESLILKVYNNDIACAKKWQWMWETKKLDVKNNGIECVKKDIGAIKTITYFENLEFHNDVAYVNDSFG